MMSVIRFLFYTFALLGLASCSARITDALKSLGTAASLSKESAIILFSNSTTQDQAACTQVNKIVVQKNIPLGETLYCRDSSALQSGLSLGPTCPGGVSIHPIQASSAIRECSEMTVCGVPPSLIQTVGQRTDGGNIEQLSFTNVPWGCNASIDFSFDPNFPSDSVTHLSFYVQPPDCPFCATQNQPTCLACTALTPGQRIVAGEVIETSCEPNCKSCQVLDDPSKSVAHGTGKLYFQSQQGSCVNKCANESLLRICSDGLWQGDPSYQFSQCTDSACGCVLPSNQVTYSHLHSMTVYQSSLPACGVSCQSVGLDITCNDGTWYNSEDPTKSYSASDLLEYTSQQCSTRTCPCSRPGREPSTINDGGSSEVWMQPTGSCSLLCAAQMGTISCNAGTLSGNTSYGFDSCQDANCGCQVSLTGGGLISISNGQSSTVFEYAQNTTSVPDACTNPAYQTRITCNNTETSSFDKNIFKYANCNSTPLSCTYVDGNGSQFSVAPGKTITVSVTATPGCDETCQNLNLTCRNSVFYTDSGQSIDPAALSNYKNYGSCTAPLKTCTCTTPWGANVDDINKGGPPLVAYSISSPQCSDGASACANHAVNVTCQGGQLQTSPNTPLQTLYPTCQAPLCNCTLGEVTVPITNPPTTQVFYSAEEAPTGVLCSAISKTLTCTSGGIWVGGDPSAYPYSDCLDYTDDGYGGGTGGGTGNDQGPGAGIKQRLGLSDGGGAGGYGSPCVDFVNGCPHNQVFINIPAFPKLSCTLPWGGGEVEFYSDIAAFSTQCVVAGFDKCSNYRIVRTCHFPDWTGDASYQYPSCQEKSSCP